MDRPISSTEQKKASRTRWLRWVWLGLTLVAAFFAFRKLISPKADRADFRFATVDRGPIENTVTASGMVVPAFEQILTAPTNARIEKVHLQSGTQVEPGDVILELDDEYVRLEYDQLQDELDLRKTNVVSLKLQYDKDLRDLDLEDQIKALQLSSLEALLADAQRLQKIGGSTGEEVEKAALDLQIARLEKLKLENDLAYRQKALNSDRRKLELEVQIQEKKLRELARKLNETQVTAPQAGVVTWINEEIGKNVMEGEMVVKLANLSSFRIEGTVSDMYANRIKVGQSVKVRINQEYLEGIVVSILPAVENNTVQFHLNLTEPTHASLRPNMQVEVFLITDHKEEVLRVVNGPAFGGGREQSIFVVQGDKAVKTLVRVGLNNLEYVELSGDIRPGDRIIISDMRDYEHLNEITLTK